MSANRRTFEPIHKSKSLKYTRKRSGLSTAVPGGTPDLTWASDEDFPLTTTCWVLWLRKDFIHDTPNSVPACDKVFGDLPCQRLY